MLMNAESVAASFTLVETDEQRGKPKTLVDFSLLFLVAVANDWMN